MPVVGLMAPFSSRDRVARLTPLRSARSSSDHERSKRRSLRRWEIRWSIEELVISTSSICENFSHIWENVKGWPQAFSGPFDFPAVGSAAVLNGAANVEDEICRSQGEDHLGLPSD